MSIDELIEGVDFNWETVDGVRIRVFSREYLLQVRPQCCKSYYDILPTSKEGWVSRLKIYS